MASPKTRRRSRKARSSRPVPSSGPQPEPAEPSPRSEPKVAPRVAARAKSSPSRRQQREERERQAARERALANRSLGTYGERPAGIFEPVPVSEIAILAGLVAVVVGLLEGGGPALIVGAIVCAVGVVEFTAREHFSGYRSHAMLLAAVPAVVVEVLLALFVGVPTRRILLLAPVLPVFAFSFWLLHRAFGAARHARVTKPPAP